MHSIILVLFEIGGDLSRVEGRSVKPYWTLLFSDILLFAKVSRDRVLFITEEPLPLANIVDSCFNIRKKCKLLEPFMANENKNGEIIALRLIHFSHGVSYNCRSKWKVSRKSNSTLYARSDAYAKETCSKAYTHSAHTFARAESCLAKSSAATSVMKTHKNHIFRKPQ